MKLAAAQTKPIDGDIEANIADHLTKAGQAADNGARLILFPEMSLTGYQREGARTLAFVQNDTRLDRLRVLSQKQNIIIAAGAPLAMSGQLHIGSIILLPNLTELIYTKQFLHEGEEIYFSPCFEHNPLLQAHGERISMAICADIAHPEHAASAAGRNTTLYLASIFYTPDGIADGHQRLGDYSTRHNMSLLMANYGGPSYQFEAGGRSAFWNNKGEMISQLGCDEEGVLMADTNHEHQ